MYIFTKYRVYVPYFISTYYPMDSIKALNIPFETTDKLKNYLINDYLFLTSYHGKSLKNIVMSKENRS
jgi:hypothetical protein